VDSCTTRRPPYWNLMCGGRRRAPSRSPTAAERVVGRRRPPSRTLRRRSGRRTRQNCVAAANMYRRARRCWVAAAAEYRRTRIPQTSLWLVGGDRRRALLHDAAAAAPELDVRRPPPSTSALADGSRGCGWSAAAAFVSLSTTQRPRTGTVAHAVVRRRPTPSTGAPYSCKIACRSPAAAAAVDFCTTRRPPHWNLMCGGRRPAPPRSPKAAEDVARRRRPPT